MLRKRNSTLILLAMLVLLAGGAYFLSSNNSSDSSKIDIRDRQFAVENRDDIGKIFIAQRNEKKLTLSKVQGEWKINDEFIAHPNIVDNLLDVVTGIQLKYIPPQSAYKTMINAIGRLGVKVEIYDLKGELLKAYQVGGTTSGELGTVFIMDGYNQPYVMELPFFEGSLRGRFLYDKPDQLRDRTIFEYEPKDINSISISYPKDQSSSFRLERENDVFVVKPFTTDRFTNSNPVLAGSIERFLRGFKDLDAEAFENQHVLRDSINGLVPIVEVKVENLNGEEKSIRMFSSLDVFNPEINTREVNTDKRVERYFVDCSWGDFMLVQHLLFGKILWKYEEFFE